MTYGAERSHILLVEDEPAQARLMQRILQRDGAGPYLLTHAASLEKALIQLSDENVDVVLLDLNLPDSIGVDTFHAINEQRPDLPIIILSGQSDEALAVETVKQGAQDYLMKGKVDIDSIVRSIRFAIERKKSVEENKQLQMMLHQERRLEAIGVLASGVAHEVNTPLQFIGANIAFLQKAFQGVSKIISKIDSINLAGDDQDAFKKAVNDLNKTMKETKYEYLREQVTEAIDETIDGVRRAHSIISAMNIFSRRSRNSLMKYDVNSALGDALIVSRNEWKYIADVNTNFDENLPPVSCYPEELCQVFLNLIINAVHAIKDSGAIKEPDGDNSNRGEITITTTRNEDNVEVRIGDSGTGIPTDVQHRIFEPFFTTKEIGKGSGQGLSIAHGIIVEKHKGKLVFETVAGEGTVFIVTLPIDRHEINEEGNRE